MDSGVRFDQYEILRRADDSLWELGRGAMGVTYVAMDTELQRRVVLKVIHPGILGKQEVLERFQREARAAAALRHPNIASVYRLGRSADGTDYYSMEYCEGETLQDAVNVRGPLPVGEALRLTLQVAKALIVAGDQHVVHRDLKPSNLILTPTPDEGVVAKVIDFGLAKTVAEGHGGFISQGSGFSGTLQYASPEQLEEGAVDERADIYALGGCLWFMLTGHPPFEGSLAVVIKQKMITELSWQRISHVPLVVHDLLRRMMARDPGHRHQTAAELRRELETCAIECASALTMPPVPSLGQSLSGSKSGSSISTVTTQPYAERFQLDAVLWQDSLGTVVRAVDASNPSARVAVRQIDCSLTAVPMVRRTLEERLRAAKRRSHPNLQLVRDFGVGDGQLGYAFPWADGFSLRQVLTKVDVLSVEDALRLLRPLAAASDFAEQTHLEGFDLTPEQILLHFPAGLREDQKARYISSPLADWPEFELTTSCLAGGLFAAVGSASIGPGSGGLSLASADNFGGGQVGPAPLAKFAAELLGCRVGRSGEWQQGNAVDAASFAVLCRAMQQNGQPPFATCAAFVNALEAARKQPSPQAVTASALSAPLPGPVKLEPLPPPPAVSQVTPKKSSSGALWGAVAAVVLLLGGGAGYYFGVYVPEHNKKSVVKTDEPKKEQPPKDPKAEPKAEPKQETKPETDPKVAQTDLPKKPDTKPQEPPKEDPKPEAPKLPDKPEVVDNPKMEPKADTPPEKPEPPPIPPKPDPKKLAMEKEAAVRKRLNDFYQNNDYESGFKLLEDNAEVFPDHEGWNPLADKLADLAVQAMQRGNKLTGEMKDHAAYWAKRKVPAAMEMQGLILASNKSADQSLEGAYQHFSDAAAAGRKTARFLQAECLYRGKGVTKDVAEAKKLLEVCVKEENLPGTNLLGHILHQEGNDSRAAQLFQIAADAGFPEAIRNLGALYVNGQGVSRDAKAGAELFRQAAEKGDVQAMQNYARCLEMGLGVPQSATDAQNWRKKAAAAINGTSPAANQP